MKIAIIGAGIAGLTTAIALQKKGYEPVIYESAKAFKPVGAGINLASNAMEVYKRLGLYDDIIKQGHVVKKMCITNKDMETLSTSDLTTVSNFKSVAIHRSDLHQILVNHFKGVIELGKTMSDLTIQDNQGVISFEDGNTYSFDLVIGADGIHSKVREALFGSTPYRYAKQVCWRGIAKTTTMTDYNHSLNELWGNGKRFGFVRIKDDSIYWFALDQYKSDYVEEFKNTSIKHLFSNFHPVAKTLIDSTPETQIIKNSIVDFEPLKMWYHKNICLVGDAAHATTPNMGQGACQAIESSYVLSDCISKYNSLEDAFKNYQTIRKEKATMVIKQSWQLGQVAQWKHPIAIWLRNVLLKMTPDSYLKNKSETLFKLNF